MAPKTVETLIQNFHFEASEVVKIFDYFRSKTGAEEYNLTKFNLSYFQDAITDMKYRLHCEKSRKEAHQILTSMQNINLTDFDFSKLAGVITGEELEILQNR